MSTKLFSRPGAVLFAQAADLFIKVYEGNRFHALQLFRLAQTPWRSPGSQSNLALNLCTGLTAAFACHVPCRKPSAYQGSAG
jgi:hypothetical protein